MDSFTDLRDWRLHLNLKQWNRIIVEITHPIERVILKCTDNGRCFVLGDCIYWAEETCDSTAHLYSFRLEVSSLKCMALKIVQKYFYPDFDIEMLRKYGILCYQLNDEDWIESDVDTISDDDDDPLE